MAGNNKAEVKFGGDASEVKRAAKDASDAIKQSTGSMRSDLGDASKGASESSAQIANSVSRMGASIKKELISVAAGWFGLQAVISSIRGVIGVASEFEQLEIQLRAVMGTAEAGDRAFAWIKQFAVDTPYSVEATTKAFMMLKNFGLDPMDGTLKKIADAASKYGGSLQAVTQISLPLGQAWAANKLQGQDILQMINAGIPVWDMLAKATGKSNAELRKMSESGQLTRSVIRQLIDELGRSSAGTSEAKMNTMAGAFSNLGDSISSAIDKPRKAGGFAWITNSLKILSDLVPVAAELITSSCTVIGDVFSGLWTVVSRVTMEIATAIDFVFGTNSKSMTALEFFKNILRVVSIAVTAFGAGIKASFTSVVTSLNFASNAFKTFGQVALSALKLDFDGAIAAWEKGVERGKRIVADGTEEMVRIATEGRDRINAIALGDSGSGAGRVANNKQKSLTSDDMPASGGGKSRLGDWSSALLDMKVAYQKANDMREMDKRDELAYWQDILATKKLSGQEQLAVRRNIAQAELDVLKNQKREEKGLEEGRIAHMRRLGEEDIALAREQLRAKSALGIISQEEELRSVLDLENQKHQIQLEALNNKLSLYEQDKLARQKVLDEIEVLERTHAKARTKIGNDILIAQKKEVDKWLSPVTSAVQQSVNGMIQGTLTWKKAVSNIFQSVLGQFISMGVKMLANWISTQVAKRAATTATAAQEATIQATAAAQQAATQKVLGVTSVMSNASIAATGAMASVSAIPFYGWAMAPAVGAQTYATALGFLPSAEGGWDIPAGATGLMRFHEKEMMLPAKYAEVIRGMAETGGGHRGGDTLNIHAVDARSIEKMFERRGGAIVKSVKKQARNFVR